MEEVPASEEVQIELFVQGQSMQSLTALEVVRRVCEMRLESGYRLEVIDVQQQPERLDGAGIMAVPALIRRYPPPVLRTTGQLTEERVLQGLGLAEQSAEGQA